MQNLHWFNDLVTCKTCIGLKPQLETSQNLIVPLGKPHFFRIIDNLCTYIYIRNMFVLLSYFIKLICYFIRIYFISNVLVRCNILYGYLTYDIIFLYFCISNLQFHTYIFIFQVRYNFFESFAIHTDKFYI